MRMTGTSWIASCLYFVRRGLVFFPVLIAVRALCTSPIRDIVQLGTGVVRGVGCVCAALVNLPWLWNLPCVV